VADAATIRTDENRRIGLEVEESNEDGSRLWASQSFIWRIAGKHIQ
jgi:hypothetical protein